MRNLPCRRVQADEIWAFVSAKAKNAKTPGDGDIWTFEAVCADTKLVVSWLVGDRNREHAEVFMRDVASRLAHRVQLTTDGHTMYLAAVENAFGWNGVDFRTVAEDLRHGTRGRAEVFPANLSRDHQAVGDGHA